MSNTEQKPESQDAIYYISTLSTPSITEVADIVPSRRSSISVGPFEKSFGHTIGNSLRRILLSSLKGNAVTKVKINGVSHEFSTISGVKEDVIDVILNIKQLEIKGQIDRPINCVIDVNKAGPVTAEDIQCKEGLEIINKDFVICNLSKKMPFYAELTVESGKGYSVAGKNDDSDDVDTIAIDVSFSPVVKVAYSVDNIRVGSDTGYEKLTIDVTTNGTIEPRKAIEIASTIMQDQLIAISAMNVENFRDKEQANVSEKSDEDTLQTLLTKKVDELEFSVRSANCLKNDNIIYIGDLVVKSESDMLRTPNFGKKSLDEIKEILGRMNLRLGMDVPSWGNKNVDNMESGSNT